MLDIADNPVENIIRFFPMVSGWIGKGIAQEFSELTNFTIWDTQPETPESS